MITHDIEQTFFENCSILALGNGIWTRSNQLEVYKGKINQRVQRIFKADVSSLNPVVGTK